MKNLNILYFYKGIRLFSLWVAVVGICIYLNMGYVLLIGMRQNPDWSSVPLFLKLIGMSYGCLAFICAPFTILGYFVFRCKSPKSNLWGLGFFVLYSNPWRLWFSAMYGLPTPFTIIFLTLEMLFVMYVISIWNHRKYEEKFQEKLQGLKLSTS